MGTWQETVFSDGTGLFITPINPAPKEAFTIHLRVAKEAPLKAVYIRYLWNGEETVKEMTVRRQDELFCYYGFDYVTEQPSFLYRFILVSEEGVYFYNQKGLSCANTMECFDFRLLIGWQPVDWMKEGVCYQIFPDRFCNGEERNDVTTGEYQYKGFTSTRMAWEDTPQSYDVYGNVDFFGGDLQGIEKQLPYLKELGITCLYLNPIFTAYSHHKYDCIDYFSVDPHLGGDEALARLCEAVHQLDMRIILDISINHTGIAHPWVTACRDYYYADDAGNLACWLDYESLPTLNYENPKVREVIYGRADSALRKWLNPPYSIDGWRFDVGQSVGKMGKSKIDQPIWREIRTTLKEAYPNFYFLAEHWDDCVRYLQGDMWDATMNYGGFNRPMRKYLGQNDPFLHGKINGAMLMNRLATVFMEESQNHYARIPYQLQQLQFNLIDSHDIDRLFLDPAISLANKKAALVMLFTFMGIPSIYYGDEVGIAGRLGVDTGARYPMSWKEETWDMAYLALHRELIALRNHSSILQTGSMKYITVAPAILCYMRFDAHEAMLFIHSEEESAREVVIDVRQIGAFKELEAVGVIDSPVATLTDGILRIQLGLEDTGLYWLR